MRAVSEKKIEKRPVRASAVVSIVIWSVVFCVLGGILLAGLAGSGIDVSVFNLPGVHISFGGFTYEDANEYSVGNAVIRDTITDLEINWIAGDVTVVASETDEITVTEDYGGEEDALRLRWRVEDGKLTVQFRKPTLFGTSNSVSKNLTVAIPASVLEAMGDVEITVVSSDVVFTGNADELTLDAVKGDLTVSGDMGELEVNAVEGKVTFAGAVRRAEYECVDATVTMYLDMAADLSFDQVDGDVTLYLSDEITGFSAELDALGGKITAEGFEGTSIDGSKAARWGDGSLRIDANGVGAKLIIKKLTVN